MKLDFEIQETYSDGVLMQFGHEPDNLFIKYFLDESRVNNLSTVPSNGSFSDLVWREEARRITAVPVTNFGVKSFPQHGAYGFYTPKYGDGSSKVIVPINRRYGFIVEPMIQLEQDTDNVTVTLVDPWGVNYECYRIIFRQGDFAHEFITYDKELTINKMVLPPGEYIVTVIGHIPSSGVVSHESTTLMSPLVGASGFNSSVLVVSWNPGFDLLVVGTDNGPTDLGCLLYKRSADTLQQVTLPSNFPRVPVDRIEWSENGDRLYINKKDSDELYAFNVNASGGLSSLVTGNRRLTYNKNIAWDRTQTYLAVGFPSLAWYKSNLNVGYVVT